MTMDTRLTRATPVALFVGAAIAPATCVPCQELGRSSHW
jgi:hypothetical protein